MLPALNVAAKTRGRANMRKRFRIFIPWLFFALLHPTQKTRHLSGLSENTFSCSTPIDFRHRGFFCREGRTESFETPSGRDESNTLPHSKPSFLRLEHLPQQSIGVICTPR